MAPGVLAPAIRARSGLAPARGGSIARTSVQARAQLQQLVRDLDVVGARLGEVRTEALDDDAHDRWADAMDAVELALARADAALRAGPSALFERELPTLQATLALLADNVVWLRPDEAVIDAVSRAHTPLSRVIVLGR